MHVCMYSIYYKYIYVYIIYIYDMYILIYLFGAYGFRTNVALQHRVVKLVCRKYIYL